MSAWLRVMARRCGLGHDGEINYKQFSDLLFAGTRPNDEHTSFISTSRDYAKLEETCAALRGACNE